MKQESVAPQGARCWQTHARTAITSVSMTRKMKSLSPCSSNPAWRTIFARIFGWEFKVVKIDKEAQEYYAQLTAFYQQFRRIGNNYNQCVKTIHTIYGEKKSLAFLYKLAEETRKLEELCKQIIELTKRFEKEYLTKKE